MRKLWWQFKQFFAAWPAPGSWAYKFAAWAYERKRKDKENGHVSFVQRTGSGLLKISYTGPISDLNWDLWAVIISGELIDSASDADEDFDDELA